MRSRAASILLLALPAAIACATTHAELGARVRAIDDTLASLGLSPFGAPQRGSLARGRPSRARLELPVGCVTIVAVADESAGDLDLVLSDARGAPVARDLAHDAQASLHACLEHAGAFELALTAQGDAAYVLRAYSGASTRGAPSASATASGVTTSGRAGTCEAPIELTAGEREGDTTTGVARYEGSCAKNDAPEIVYRLELAARKRVVVDVQGSFDVSLYVRRRACDDADAEIACSDDAGRADRARVDAVLEPGVYFVVVDGAGTETGAFRMTTDVRDAPDVARACRDAPLLDPLAPAAGSTAGGFDYARASCGGGAPGLDAPYRLVVRPRARVRLSERSEATPVLHVRRVCSDPASEIACAQASYGRAHDAVVTGIFDAGVYGVFADAREVDGAAFALRAEMAPEHGDGVRGDACADAVPIAAGEIVHGDTFRARDDLPATCGEGSAPDVVYRFDVSSRARLAARVVSDESPHVLSLFARSCASLPIDCGAQLDAIVDPGSYFLVVDGARDGAFGRFDASLRLHDLVGEESACASAPTLLEGRAVHGTTAGSGDRFLTSCGATAEGHGAPDRVFKLVLAKSRKVHLALETPGWAGVVALRRACAEGPSVRAIEAACSPAQRLDRAATDAALDPGTYFVVIDGAQEGSAGPFSLTLTTSAR